MLTDFKYDREDIVKKIFKIKPTKDSNFLLPVSLAREIQMRGGETIDDKYYYPRKMFENNLYFSLEDITLFLAQKSHNIREEAYYTEQSRFALLNQEIVGRPIKQRVGGKLFTVEELIDMNEVFNWRNYYKNN